MFKKGIYTEGSLNFFFQRFNHQHLSIMSDFFSKLKGVFIVEDPNAAATTQPKNNPQPTTQIVASSQPVANTASVSATYSAGNGQVSDKFFEVLARAMEAANQDGFDYFEFRQALANLKNVPMDDATRYKSAFAMSQAMGVTADKLINSAAYYVDVLKNEQNRFVQAANNQRQAQVGDKQAQSDNLEAVMRQKAEQIKQLTAEIEQHRKEVDTIKSDISQAVVKVEQTSRDFDATYQLLVGQIQADVNSMRSYLK
jgi:cell division septum initiation protein DivIVA